MTEKINKLFPKKVLNAWLRLLKQLNHHDWLSILDKLRNGVPINGAFLWPDKRKLVFIWKPIAAETPY